MPCGISWREHRQSDRGFVRSRIRSVRCSDAGRVPEPTRGGRGRRRGADGAALTHPNGLDGILDLEEATLGREGVHAAVVPGAARARGLQRAKGVEGQGRRQATTIALSSASTRKLRPFSVSAPSTHRVWYILTLALLHRTRGGSEGRDKVPRSRVGAVEEVDTFVRRLRPSPHPAAPHRPRPRSHQP